MYQVRLQSILFSLLILCLFSFIAIGCNDSEPRNDTSNNQPDRVLNYESTVAFLSTAGDTLSTIRAAVADDQESRTEGLMNVTNMPEDAGMIFIFENNQPRSFWMASTPLSLDLIFANDNFEIVRIHRNAAPYSQESITSGAPAKYVVEVNAGYTIEHDINEGSYIAIIE